MLPRASMYSVYIDYAPLKTPPSLTTMTWKSFKGLENKEKTVLLII